MALVTFPDLSWLGSSLRAAMNAHTATYDERARERWVAEPAKRVEAPERTPFERDRARVVHSAALRRLAAKTQVVGPDTDFARNRLTHSLEVAQVARDVAHVLGCHPDVAETAALAHDMGHPPFGHNGEEVLDGLMHAAGGFEGNAQTLRILTRLEPKSWSPQGRSIGLNLTRATLDACTKYPWFRRPGLAKFGVYADDADVFSWLREDVEGDRRCVEAQVMDFADDVAYSVHDVEDGIVSGAIELGRLTDSVEREAVWQTVREWYLPEALSDDLDQALVALSQVRAWPSRVEQGWPTGYDGTRSSLARLKNLTSDLIGIFCGEVQHATQRVHGVRPLSRYDADLVVPQQTLHQIGVLKGIAAHYVMRTDERVRVMGRQAEVITELFETLNAQPHLLEPMFAADHAAAPDDAARKRVVCDQVASLTDGGALAWHQRVC